MSLAAILRHLYPGIVIGEQGAECSIAMDADGVSQIETWNRPEPLPTAAEIEAARKPAALAMVSQRIKEEARQRILAVLPEWKQANATARAVELVAAGQASGPEWEAMQASWGWVKAVRQHSNALEAQAAELDDPTSLDITAGWP